MAGSRLGVERADLSGVVENRGLFRDVFSGFFSSIHPRRKANLQMNENVE